MDKEILFSEKQYFRQWWLWLILAGVNALFLFGIFTQVIGGKQFGDKPMSNAGLIFSSSLSLIITVVLLNSRLETQVKKDGLYVRFFPFHLSFRHYKWEDISKCFVRQYNAIGEYGGWGLRVGLFGKGKALNVSGNWGLQLELPGAKKLLIGTNQPDELTKTLTQLNQLKQ